MAGDLFNGGVNEARADGGDQAADLDIAVARDARGVLLARERDGRRSAHEAGRAFAVERDRQRRGRLAIANRRGARVGAFQPGDADAQRRLIGVGRRLDKGFAAGDAALQDRRIDERREHALPRRRHDGRDGELHGRRPNPLSYPRESARSIARRVLTSARCARNTADAWMSESGSTPSAACDAASAIACGVGVRCPARSPSTSNARYALAATPVIPTRTTSWPTTTAAPASAKPLAFCSVFSYATLFALAGTRTSTMISFGSSAVCSRSTKNADALTVRRPRGPARSISASSARMAAG